jgi:histidine triad (HIT) family protein
MSDKCLFCKIIKGEIPSNKVFENDLVYGFEDIYPQAKTHVLFVHKNHTPDITHMVEDGNTIAEVFKAISDYTKNKGLDSNGFRIVANTGKNAGQTVFHTHFHVLGGEPLARFGK